MWEDVTASGKNSTYFEASKMEIQKERAQYFYLSA